MDLKGPFSNEQGLLMSIQVNLNLYPSSHLIIPNEAGNQFGVSLGTFNDLLNDPANQP